MNHKKMSSSTPYIVSARKYRPATFGTVVGQRALTATLKNAITGGKLAQAYLFCGPRGVGKTSCARIFAKTINCLNPTSQGEACGECESCKAIDKGNSFNLVELDAASNNSVDDIRNITEQVNIPAQDGRYRVFIIDEVHMLTSSAFNAFLKTLEEPPKNVVFILATTERHKVIPTILSRCQIYDFRRITVNDIIDHLEFVAKSEGINAEREALGVIALKADGAMRDALSIFDQVAASTLGNITYEGAIEALNVLDQDYYFKLVDVFKNGDTAEALLILKEIIDKGFDPQFFINGLASHIRNLMVCADPRTEKLLETSEEFAKKYMTQAPTLPVEWYYTAIKILNDVDFNYRTASNKRLLVELALIRLSRLLSAPSTLPFSQPADNKKPQVAPVKPVEANKEEGKTPSPNPPVVQKEERGGPPPKAETAVPRPRLNARPSSFRLSSETRKPEDRGEEEAQDKEFSDEEFKSAWENYAPLHPDQRILAAAMRGAKLQRIDKVTFKAEVGHPAQKQAFEGALSQLSEYFKSQLGNKNIKLEIEINDDRQEDTNISPKEFLKLTIEENPVLANFLKEIDAELE